MASIVLIVSASDSPLFRLELAAAKFNVSADSLFAASSKDRRVRVEFSKKASTTVRPVSSGNFTPGCQCVS